MVRLSGAALGFFAFAITVLRGLAVGNPVEVILQRALIAMLLFCVLGLIVGWIAFRVIDDHAIRLHKEMFSEHDPEEADETDGTAEDRSKHQTSEPQPAKPQA